MPIYRPTTVLIAEDEPLISETMVDVLTDAGFVVCGVATNISEGMHLVQTQRPDIAVLDVMLANGDLGVDLARQIRALDAGTPVLFCTGTPEHCVDAGAGDAYVAKPYRLDVLCRAVQCMAAYNSSGQLTEPPPEMRILGGGLFAPERGQAAD